MLRTCSSYAALHCRTKVTTAVLGARNFARPAFREAVEFAAPQPGGYGEIEYWNKRYSKETNVTLDWFYGYTDFEPILSQHIAKSGRVLMAGCGNSAMPEDMVNDGYKEIVNIDLSSVVIENLQVQHRDVPQLSYLTMDASDMSAFEDHSFDVAIDKGLADAMLCGVDGADAVVKMIKETYRILKPQGVFVLITYGSPVIRMPALRESGMDWKTLLYILPKHNSEAAVNNTIEGRTCPDPIALNSNDWQGQTWQEENGLTFVYVCTKPQI